MAGLGGATAGQDGSTAGQGGSTAGGSLPVARLGGPARGQGGPTAGLAGARERWIRTGGIELCVAELGETGLPTVLLVHGYPDSKEVWSEVATRLAENFHVVLYDIRGHGRSTAPARCAGASPWRS